MSQSAEYILWYEPQGYLKPTPMDLDITYLTNNFKGDAVKVSQFVTYFYKLTNPLLDDELMLLGADEILVKISDGFNFKTLRKYVDE
jgi:hypothetical protein